MSKVIQMADWRNRKPKALSDRDVVVNEVTRLLKLSIESNNQVRYGVTVPQREAGVVNGLKYLMAAHEYAKQHGVTIERHEDPDGSIRYTVRG